MSQNILLAPGPVPMPPEVCEALSRQMIHHRTPEFSETLKACLEELKTVFQTQQPVMILPSTGSGGMEAAVVNCFSAGDEVLNIVSGKFGERWADICEDYGLNVTRYEVEWGTSFEVSEIENILDSNPNIKGVFTQYSETSTATAHPVQDLAAIVAQRPNTLFLIDAISAVGAMPLKMDEWQIDVVVGGAQKAFMIPAGLSFIALSETAWAWQKKSQLPKYYFNLEAELNANKKLQTNFSSPVNLIMGLKAALNFMNSEDKLNNLIERSSKLGQAIKTVAEVYRLEVFSQSPSNSVTALSVPENIDATELRLYMEQNFNVTMMGGQDHLKGRILRIGHLGAISDEMILTGFDVLGKSLMHFGHNISVDDIALALNKAKEVL